MHDVIWDVLYAPIGNGIGFVTARMNVLQFLTIRRYLSLVFVALITLLLVLTL
jgi:hydrogenase-4 component B